MTHAAQYIACQHGVESFTLKGAGFYDCLAFLNCFIYLHPLAFLSICAITLTGVSLLAVLIGKPHIYTR